MAYRLAPQDYQMLLEQFGGDAEAAHAALKQRGYMLPDEEEPSSLGGNAFAVREPDEGEDAGGFAAKPGLSVPAGLSGVLDTQRRSIGNLYDTITQNIEKRYRAPDLNDMLVHIGMGMMAPPGENDAGGFAGSLQRGLRGIGTYAQNRRAYETDMNKMLSEVEVRKAQDLAGLEEKYLSAAASAMKPRVPRAVGTQVVNGKVVTVLQDPDTGEITTTEIGQAPVNLKPMTGVTSGGQPVFIGPNGPVSATGAPVTEFDVKAKPISATEQREIFEVEDVVNSGLGTVKTLEEALNLNNQAYEGSLSGWRKTVGQLFSSDDPQYVATENFDNLVVTGALQSLKATFGANPTEGERKILLDLQAISSKPRAVREEILRRALAAAKTRIARETTRLQRLKGGEYSTRGGSTAGGSGAGGTRVIRYDKNGKRI